MSLIRELIFQRVIVFCTDGAVIIGDLAAYDRTTNLVLARAEERIVLPNAPPIIKQMGALVIRGDCVALIGPIRQDMESEEPT